MITIPRREVSKFKSFFQRQPEYARLTQEYVSVAERESMMTELWNRYSKEKDLAELSSSINPASKEYDYSR